MSSSGPYAHCPTPWSSIDICHWTPELAGLWKSCGAHYAACHIVQHDQFGGGSVMVWGGKSLKGRTDLYRLENGTLTAIRYRGEILGPIVRPYADAVGPQFFLVHVSCGETCFMWWKHCRQFLEDEEMYTIEWSTHSPVIYPLEHLWDIVSVHLTPPGCTSDCPGAQWCPVPDLGGNTQDTIHRLIRSMSRQCQARIRACRGHTNYWVPFWVAAKKID